MIKATLILAILLTLVGCGGTHSQPNIEPVQNMMEMPSIKAQELDPTLNGVHRLPVEGTVPRGFYPYKLPKDLGVLDQAGKMQNPVPRTMEVLKKGQWGYNTYCIVCHGERGDGDGSVVERGFMRPPSLNTDKIRQWEDGKLFHTMTVGQNLMPGYGAQISRHDRWAIVHYIRALTRANNPTDADLQDFKSKQEK